MATYSVTTYLCNDDLLSEPKVLELEDYDAESAEDAKQAAYDKHWDDRLRMTDTYLSIEVEEL